MKIIERPKATPEIRSIGSIFVVLSQLAAAKIAEIVDQSNAEVGWFGTASMFEDDKQNRVISIADVFLLPQKVTGATVDVDKEHLIDWIVELEKETGDDNINSKLLYWGHSHVEMGVFSSGTDDDQLEEFIESGNAWYVVSRTNKKGDCQFDYIDSVKGLIYENIPWEIDYALVDVKEDIKAHLAKYISKDKSFGSKYPYGGYGGLGWGKDYYDWEEEWPESYYNQRKRGKATDWDDETKDTTPTVTKNTIELFEAPESFVYPNDIEMTNEVDDEGFYPPGITLVKGTQAGLEELAPISLGYIEMLRLYMSDLLRKGLNMVYAAWVGVMTTKDNDTGATYITDGELMAGVFYLRNGVPYLRRYYFDVDNVNEYLIYLYKTEVPVSKAKLIEGEPFLGLREDDAFVVYDMYSGKMLVDDAFKDSYVSCPALSRLMPLYYQEDAPHLRLNYIGASIKK